MIIIELYQINDVGEDSNRRYLVPKIVCKSVEMMTGDIVEEAIGFVIEK